MKLLFDENLSPKLAKRLADIFPGSAHVHDCGLGSTDDFAIWRYAAERDFVLVSKDADFYTTSILRSAPPKFVWLRTGNCAVTRLEAILRTHSVPLHQFASGENACLVLS